MEEPGKIELLPTLLLLSLILFIIVAGVLILNQQFNKKLYRQKLEAEQLRSLHQQELLRTSIRVQEEERRNIARNLHDELGAALSMTRMLLFQLEEQTGQEKWSGSVLKIREMTEAALSTTRRISHELIPPQLEAFGLAKTLEATITQLNSLSRIEIKLSFPDDFPRLTLPEELGLYRICMELTNNTLKHAKASRISIDFLLKEQFLQLRYGDNGIGLPEDGAHNGLGLKNIEARTQAMGGTVVIENRKPSGIQAVIALPVYPETKTELL